MSKRKEELSLDQLSTLIMNQAPDAILVMGATNQLIEVNNQACQQLGYSRAELLTLHLENIQPSSKGKSRSQIKQEITQKISNTSKESLCVRKDGSTFWVEVHNSFITFNGQEYHIVYIRDISDRKQVEKNLLEEKAIIDTMMDNFPDSIYLKDRECRFTRVNNKLLHDLGFENKQEALGKTDIDVLGKEFGENTIKVDRKIIETGQPSIGLIERRQLDNGEENWTISTKVPLINAEGEVFGIAGISQEINEIKRNEAELKIKENQLSIASKIAGLGYWEFNVDEGLFTFNDHFYQVFHTSIAEVGRYKMKPKEYAELFLLPEEQYMVEEELGKAIATSDPNHGMQFEHRIKYPDGEIGYVAVRFFIVKDELGRTIKTFGVNQNITERKLAEQAAKDGEAQMLVATQIAKLGYWEFDETEGLFTFTDQFYAVLKTSAAAVGGYKMTIEEYSERFFLPEDAPSIHEEIGQLITNGTSNDQYYLEHRVRYADGDIGYVAVRFYVIRDEHGNVYKQIGANQDITDIKLAERALKESEITVQKAFEIAMIGPYQYHIKGDRFEWTQKALDVIGLPPDMIPDNLATFFDFVEVDDKAKITAGIEKREASRLFDVEYRINVRGKKKWIRFKSHLAYNSEGKPVKYIGIVQDVTERKLAEKELVNYRNHLEQLVEERTLQLESSNQELEAFAYSISHDLRAPIRHINGFASILKRKLTESEGVIKYVNLIDDASKRMGVMIDALLNFSRLGRQVINESTVDINTLVAEIITTFKPDIKERNLSWKIGLLPTVTGDADLLKIAFENLISNAIKYTQREPEALIEINTCNNETNKCTVYIKDNGVGFDMDYSDKLFGVFQRLHQDDDFEGTGIGLANVQQIIGRHGGSIRAEAEEGKGATFFISF